MLSTGQTGAQSDSRRQLANAVAAVNQSELWPGRALKVHFDVETQRLTVQIVNSENDEVVDQIPPEQVLRMAAELAGSDSSTNDGGYAQQQFSTLSLSI